MESDQSGDGASHGHMSTEVETAKEEALAGGDAKGPRGAGGGGGEQYMYDDDYDEEDCTPLPNGLVCSRQTWEMMYSKLGSFEDETDASPMRYTDRPVLPYYLPISMMQIFSVKVLEIMGGLQWPLDVYGIIAARDSLDNKRNFLFHCEREHCQTLTSPQDSSLTLTGPSRAIVMVNPVIIEVDMKVKGRGPPSEDKVLSEHAFVHNHIGHRVKPGFTHRQLESTEDSTMEFVFAHLRSAVEATITVRVVEGSSDFKARFTARTAGIDEDVLLLDSQDSKVVVDDDGFVMLRRRVVSVEGTGKLILRLEATDHGCSDTTVVKEEIVCARKTSRSQSCFMLGFCKLSIIIAWSLLP